MAALRQTGSHCGGPRAGQVLPETQIPPKQFPSCLPATGRGILRALPGKGLGQAHKGSIFSWEAAWGWLQAAARGARTFHPGHSAAGARCPRPRLLCHAGDRRTLPGRPCELRAACSLSSSSSRSIRSSSAGLEFVFKVLHKLRPGWHPRDKVCARAEPCQALCWRSPGREKHGWGRGIPSEGDPTQSPAQAPGSGRGPGRG